MPAERHIRIEEYRGITITLDREGDSLVMPGTFFAHLGELVMSAPTLQELRVKIDAATDEPFHIEVEHPDTHERVVLVGYHRSVFAWRTEDGTYIQAHRDLYVWDAAKSGMMRDRDAQIRRLADERYAIERARPRIFWNQKSQRPGVLNGERDAEE